MISGIAMMSERNCRTTYLLTPENLPKFHPRDSPEAVAEDALNPDLSAYVNAAREWLRLV